MDEEAGGEVHVAGVGFLEYSRSGGGAPLVVVPSVCPGLRIYSIKIEKIVGDWASLAFVS